MYKEVDQLAEAVEELHVIVRPFMHPDERDNPEVRLFAGALGKFFAAYDAPAAKELRRLREAVVDMALSWIGHRDLAGITKVGAACISLEAYIAHKEATDD